MSHDQTPALPSLPATLSARDVMRVLMESAHAPRNLAYRIAHE